jgi:ribosome production factor 1
MIISLLPDGPTMNFKMSNVKLSDEIKHGGGFTKHKPEIILNNFNTRLGLQIGRSFAALFPHDPQYEGRHCITFHNQRDYIFFRHHRYIFKNSSKVGIQELGPKFTLKLRSLQKGTFNAKFGEYEWIHKVNFIFLFYILTLIIECFCFNRDTKWKQADASFLFKLINH